MGKNISLDHLVINCSTDSADFLAGTVNSDVYNMSAWEDAFFIVNLTTSDGTGTARFHINSSTDVTPTSTHACPYMYRQCLLSDTNSAMSAWTQATSSGFTSIAGDFQIYELWLKSEDLYAGDSYIRFNSTEIVNDPVGGSVSLIFANPRYGSEIAPNVLT